MRLGIFAKTFPGNTPWAVMEAARAAGYTAVQYNMACSGLPSVPVMIPEVIARDVRAAANATGVEIAAVSATYNMIHPDPSVREQGHAGLRAIAQTAAIMGTRLLTLCTGTRDPADQWRRHPENQTPSAQRDLLASMEVALGIAEENDVDLGVEPELANVIDSAARARWLIDELQSPRLKIVFDPANLFERESRDTEHAIIAHACDLLADRIAIAHAKDRREDGSATAAGHGRMDYPHYLKCLHSVGFRGPLVTHGLDAGQAHGVSAYLRSQLIDLGLQVPA